MTDATTDPARSRSRNLFVAVVILAAVARLRSSRC